MAVAQVGTFVFFVHNDQAQVTCRRKYGAPGADDDPRVALVRPAGLQEREHAVALTIHEGRKHQVKRMFLAVGHLVHALYRQSFGPLSVEDLPEGSWRLCASDEVEALLAAAGLAGDIENGTGSTTGGSDR